MKSFNIRSLNIISIDEEVQNVIKYIIPSFLAVLCFTVMTNIDMILVKHYFSGYEAGIYATSAMFGK